MNIQEAIRSGRPFMRAGASWWIVCPAGYLPKFAESDSIAHLDHVDLVADDWVIQEPEVPVTAVLLKAVIDTAVDAWRLDPEGRLIKHHLYRAVDGLFAAAAEEGHSV